jgi:hypothetical protein
VSVAGFTVRRVHSFDVVAPVDARLHDVLAQIADMTTEHASRDQVVDLMLTLPPIAQWPPEVFDECRKMLEYVRRLRRELEVLELKRMYGVGG